MRERTRDELELELSHVRFVLEQIPLWQMPGDLEGDLTGRYTRAQRVLEEVLASTAGWLADSTAVSPEAPALLQKPPALLENPNDERHHRVSFQAVPEPIRTPVMVRHPPVEIPVYRTPPPTRRVTPAPWAGSSEFLAKVGLTEQTPERSAQPEVDGGSSHSASQGHAGDSEPSTSAQAGPGPSMGADAPGVSAEKPPEGPVAPLDAWVAAWREKVALATPESAGTEPHGDLGEPAPSTPAPRASAPGERGAEPAPHGAPGEAATPADPPTAPAREEIVEARPVRQAQPRGPTRKLPPRRPAQRPTDRKAIEAVSTWRSVWKPFLYESILWFIGAFFIVAGSFYWVAESWEGMTSTTRALVVFGLAGAYSGAFAGVSRLLARRSGLARAAPVLGAIGAAIAPLAALALFPLYPSAGVIAVPLAFVWAAVTALLVAGPTRAFAPKSVRWMQALALVTTLGIGWAPMMVGLPAALLGAEGLVVALFLGMVWHVASERPSGQTLAFLLASPAYLIGVEVVRLQIGSTVPISGQMPLAILLLTGLVMIRSSQLRVVEDPLVVGILVPLQCGFVLVATGGPVWSRLASFAAMAASCAILAYRVARAPSETTSSNASRSFAVSSDQASREKDASLWELLGLTALLLAVATGGDPAGFDHLFRTLQRAPYSADGLLELSATVGLLAAVGLGSAVRWTHDESRAAFRLRWLAAACALAGCFVASMFGFDVPHPARGLVAFGVLLALTFGIGLWRERTSLVRVGSGLCLLAPWGLHAIAPSAQVPWIIALLALFLAGLSALQRPSVRKGPSVAAFVLACIATGLATASGVWLAPAISTVAVGWIAYRRGSAWLAASAGALLAFAVLTVWTSPLALAGLSAIAAGCAWRERHVDSSRAPVPLVHGVDFDAVLFSAIACLWAWLRGGALQGSPVLGPTLLLAAATLFLLSRRWGVLAHVGALLACVGALAPLPTAFPVAFIPWPHLPVAASLGIVALVGLGASVWTLWRGPGSLARTFALAAGVASLGELAFHSGALAHVGWIVAVGVLVSAPAVWAPGGIAVAALVAFAWGLSHGGDARLLTATVATGIALLDLRPKWRARVLGEAPVALAASLSALLLLVSACAVPDSFVLVGMLVLPLVALKATGEPWFSIATPLLGAWASVSAGSIWPFALALVWTALLSRALFHLRAARRLLLAEKAEEAKDRLPRELLLAGAVVGAVAVVGNVHPLPGFVVPLFWLAAFAIASETLPVRLVLAGLAVALLPSLRVGGLIPLAGWAELALAISLAVGFAARFAPNGSHLLLGGKVQRWTQPVAAWVALGLAVLLLVPTFSVPLGLQLLGVLFLCALLLGRPGVLVPGFAMLVGCIWIRRSLQELTPGFAQLTNPVYGITLASALLALATRTARAKKWLGALGARCHPDARKSWHGAIWLSAVLAWAAALLVVRFIATPTDLLALLAAALVLTWAEGPIRVWTGVALVGLAAGFALQGTPWMLAAVGIAALALAVLSRARRDAAKRWQLDAAFALSWVPLFGLHHLGEVALPVCVGAVVAICWLRVFWTKPSGGSSTTRPLDAHAELFAWIATLLGGHALLVWLGTVLSTGKPASFILPDFGALSALIAAFALFRLRASTTNASAPPLWLGRALAAVALVEVASAVALLPGPVPAPAAISALAMIFLSAMLAWDAHRKENAFSAWGSIAALLLCGLSLRLDGLGWHLGPLDAFGPVILGSVAALGGARLARTAGWKVFGAPLRLTGYLLPLAGGWAALIAFFGTGPDVFGAWMAAGALLACAAHFTAISRRPEDRVASSLLAVVAFNGALGVVWSTRVWEAPELFLIPTGLTALALLRRFRAELPATAKSRLRAMVIAGIYAVAAFRPLMFPTTWDFLVCLTLCLLGVVAGVMFRVRSYVYLGTAFLVTAVLANLVRYGARDHRLAAVFLSALGLMVLASMVLFTAKRAELLARWERMRALLSSWEA